MLKIGLTGGIGSGKSTAAHYFHELGVPIIDADKISRELTAPHSPLTKQIIDHFGNQILKNEKEIDRKKLRNIIFNNKKEKKWLESLLHPLIIHEMKNQIKKINYPYCILVIPLLVESKKIDFMDRILVIDTPIELQIKRIKQRDQTEEQSIKSIIESQSERQQRLSLADDIVLNDADLNSLNKKIKELHSFYLQLAKKEES